MVDVMTSTNIPCKFPDSCGVKTHERGSAAAAACGKTRMATYDGDVSASVGGGTAPKLVRPAPKAPVTITNLGAGEATRFTDFYHSDYPQFGTGVVTSSEDGRGVVVSTRSGRYTNDTAALDAISPGSEYSANWVEVDEQRGIGYNSELEMFLDRADAAHRKGTDPVLAQQRWRGEVADIDELEVLAGSDDPRTVANVALNMKATTLLPQLASHPSPLVRKAVTLSVWLEPEFEDTERALCNDPDMGVRASMLKTTMLKDELVRNSEHSDLGVRQAVALNDFTPRDTLARMGRTGREVHDELAVNHNTPPDTLASIGLWARGSSTRNKTAFLVANNSEAPFVELQELIGNRPETDRVAVAARLTLAFKTANDPGTAPMHLAGLANHPDDHVRASVAYNPTTPDSAIDLLRGDKSSVVEGALGMRERRLEDPDLERSERNIRFWEATRTKPTWRG